MALRTTVTEFGGGIDTEADVSGVSTVTFSGTWRECDTPQVILTDEDGLQTVIGLGDLAGLTPTFALTFKDKVYAACSTTLAFSAIGEPTQFVNQVVSGSVEADAPGNGYIVPSNNYGTPEVIQAMCLYQNRMAVFNRNSVQIWSMVADPANNEQVQVLENIGTFAPLTVQPVGELDAMFLAESGLRSLRVRNDSNNAVTVDIGTPIDSLIQAHLATLTDAQRATCCGVVEPSANRYWCFVPAASGEGTLYVLSYFPSVGVAAWSTYRPTHLVGSTNTAFAPQKFVVKDGRVYARTSNGLISYGGLTGSEYENCGLTAETPWLDAKTPCSRKHAKGVDVACAGSWTVSLGMDPVSGTLTPAYVKADATNSSSFDLGSVQVRMQGTHFKLKMVEAGTGSARLSMAALHFEPGEAR